MANPFYVSVEKFGNRLLYRGYDESGRRVKQRIDFKPVMYVEVEKGKKFTHRALDGTPVGPVPFSSMKECSDYISMYKDVESYTIYGNDRHVTSFIQRTFPNEILFDKRLIDIATLDIETESNDGFPEPEEARHEILTICIKSRQGLHLWGLKDYDVSKAESPVTYHHFRDERSLLLNFIEWFSDEDNVPDVLTGWNTRFFDLPYMVNRIVRVLGDEYAKKLSPWNMVNIESVTVMGQKRLDVNLMGLPCLDYLELFKKFALNTYGQQESYKLDYIAELVLGDKKLDYAEYGSLHELYDQNFQLFCDYNIKDVDIVDRFEEKLGMLSLVFTLAYKGGVNYYDTLGTTTIWDTIIFRYLALRNVVIPPARKNFSLSFEGGYVKDVSVGMHNWVLSFDLNSLYPSIIVQYNMSPETIVPHQKIKDISVADILATETVTVPNENLAVTANGSVYRKDIKGIVPELIEGLYDERVGYKKKMLEAKKQLETVDKNDAAVVARISSDLDRYNTLQMAVKVLLNSLYGAMGSKYFRYYNVEIAEGITTTGQLVIQWAEKHVNHWISDLLKEPKDRVIAGDTDSIFIELEDVIDKFKPVDPVKFLDQFASQGIEPCLKKAFDKLFTITNGYTNRMVMKREAIADRGIWTAKKRYILNVHNNEGVQYTEPKLKIVGIEAIKSSTPKICRTALKNMF
jgi:DNA polymerase elongation subunit (family B)